MFSFNHNQTYETLTMALDGLERREQLLANNVANMNTPGYQARELDFKQVMEDRANAVAHPDQDLEPEATSESHLGSILDRTGDVWDHAVLTTPGPPDMQDQMVRLSMNTLQYSAITQALGKQLQRYRQVISERVQ